MKKRLLALMLVVAMVMGMSMTTFAEGKTYTDTQTITLTKSYRMLNADGISPAETFTFSDLTCIEVKDAGVGVTTANAPVPTIGDVSYGSQGAQWGEGSKKDVTITLPTYTQVGIYTYIFNENAGNTAGVTYHTNDIKLVVTVIQDGEGKVRVAAVHTEGANEGKSDDIENLYSAGALTVGKVVTGILGDRDKDFTVKVIFTAPTDKIVKEVIKYVDSDEGKAITVNDWKKNEETGKVEAVATITLKHNEKVTFTNIPYDVTYEVIEDNYTDEGYDAAEYKFEDNNKKIDSEKESVMITNNKAGDVDTGIFTTNMPYILALVAIAAVAVVMFRRKREF